MKRFILSISVLSTLLLTGFYNQTMALPVSLASVAASRTPVAKLPTTSLPAPAKSYLDQHFPGYTLVRVEKAFSGGAGRGYRPDSIRTAQSFMGTKVRFLVNDVPFNLFFDANGKMAGIHAPGPAGNVDQSAYLTANQLPATVRDYLNKSYKGYTFLKAESHPSPTGTVRAYNVDILTNNQRANLHFDSTGSFRDAHIRAELTTEKGVGYVSRKELPAAIVQTLTSQYANQTYVLGEQHTGPNGTGYVVELALNNVLTRLHFDANGNAITRPTNPDRHGPEDRGPKGNGPKHGPGHDRPGHERPGHDRPGHDRPGHDRPGHDRFDRNGPNRKDRMGSERLGRDRFDQNSPGRDRQGKGGSRADASHQILLDAGMLPTAITSYLKANFNGYIFLKADVRRSSATTTDYTTNIAVGKALYNFRFGGNGDVLMAEAKN